MLNLTTWMFSYFIFKMLVSAHWIDFMTTNRLEPKMKMMVSHIEFKFFKAEFSTSLLTLSLSPPSLLISLPIPYILARKKNQTAL